MTLNPLLLALYWIAVLATAIVFSYCRNKVDESLKEGATLCREIMMQPDKLTNEGLKYRRLCCLFFGLFAFLLLGPPLIVSLFT